MAKKSKKSVEVSIGVPSVVADALDAFIEHGNGLDVKPSPRIDHKRLAKQCSNRLVNVTMSGFIRMLISGYGRKQSKVATKVSNLIFQGCHPKTYISMKTDNYEVRRDPSSRVMRLIAAMVYLRIPIPRYYDAKHNVAIEPKHNNY